MRIGEKFAQMGPIFSPLLLTTFRTAYVHSFVGFENKHKKNTINETDAHPKEILPGQNGFYDAKNSLELNWRQLMQDLPKFREWDPGDIELNNCGMLH